MNLLMAVKTRCPCSYISKLVAYRNITVFPHKHISNPNIYVQTNTVDASSSARKPNDARSFDLSHRTIHECNMEITRLGCRGEVAKARKLFDKMPKRSVDSYTKMIVVYLKNNDLHSAELVFNAMPEQGIVAESAMIDGYAKAGRMDMAQKLFDQMSERNVVSWTNLISGYFGIGKVDVALRLFDEMPEKNVVSWTTMVLGYAKNGLIDQARTVFGQMPERNVFSWTVMIKAYVDNREIEQAFVLFYEMPERNVHTWNIMIQGCLEDNRVNEAVQLFSSIPSRNAISWTIMVTGLAQNGSIKDAREFFDQMPNKDIAAWNAMITAYSDEGLMFEASELFNLMPLRNIVSWNALIDGYARHGLEREAFKLVICMLCCTNIRPNERTLTSVLISCEYNLDLLQTHGLVIRLGFVESTTLMNALVTMYSRTGDVSSARMVFEDLKAKDIVSWTSIIITYSVHGYGWHSLQAFARMLRSGFIPDGNTFLGVLSACSHAGLVKKGQRLFNSMVHAYGLEPNAGHYSCLVDILGRAGQIELAAGVVRKMPEHERDGAVLGAFLGACKLHGDVELANHIGKVLTEFEPTESGGYVVLANVNAAAGKWDEFAMVRKKMKERKVKKLPGVSEINVKGESHMFFGGDTSHPEVDQIRVMLRVKLLPLMLDIDYSRHKLSAQLSL